MSLFDMQPIGTDPVSAAKDSQQEYVIRIKQTKSGREIMVCTATTAPADVIAESVAKGLPLFTGPEILRMRDCMPEMVEHILSVKIAFPGCTVQQIIDGDVAK